MTTAAGYIINDYFDRKTDLVNRPKTVIIGKHIHRRTAIITHTIINILAVGLSFYVAYRAGMYKLGIISIIMTALLWFYSTTFKRMLLVGNIVVAALTATIPILAVIFEIPLLHEKYTNEILSKQMDFSDIGFWAIGFSFFAFILNLTREIVKDIEDYEGDLKFGRKTMPVVVGKFYTKAFILFLILFTITITIIGFAKYINDNISLWYITAFIILPLLYILVQTIRAKEKENYHTISRLLKLLMLSGLFYSFVILYNILN
ncbi:MAG: hypothetical protein A2W98_15535 [Bacteroidetes bacterium GWF2_33_38]|nr:MAG: hypothetical protein A2W98_15535 [Bacteroidetes bacterium GWF2_33_38]OFY90423.1 MAG: hypothetical protein A2236_11830 [Bacteroidetes bacterium RIFOXYA2_FULL_33_7]